MKNCQTLLFVAFSALLALGSAFHAPAPTRHSRTQLYMSDEKQTGVVKWFNTVKGYGFIVPDDGGKDIFVHQTEIKCEGFRSLADGESVEYLAQTEGNGKVKATEVTGPGGAQVKGVPFQQSNDFDSY